MHNLTQRSLVLELKAVCLHNIRWSFRNTLLVQFNDAFEFCKISMKEYGNIVQPRAKFPMPAVTQCVVTGHDILALSKSGCCGFLVGFCLGFF